MQGQKYGRDTEIVQHMRPEPMTAREEAAQAGIDDTEFEIFKHKMHMIALEGKETTMKLGASTAMRCSPVGLCSSRRTAVMPELICGSRV